MNSNLGEWEKHGKGIGAKLMFQMGCQPGKGLGKDLQGIREPVKAHVRTGREGIGLEADLISEEDDKEEQLSDEEEEEIIYPCCTTREFFQAGRRRIPIDVDEQETGRFQLKQFISKLNSLVNQCEQEINQNGKEIYIVEEKASAIESRIQNQIRQIFKQKEQLTVLTSMLRDFDRLDQKYRLRELDLRFLWMDIKCLVDIYGEDEYLLFCLANLSLCYVIPLIQLHLSKFWRPFKDEVVDKDCRLLFQQWRRLLQFKEVSSTRTIYGESLYLQKNNNSYFQMDTYDCLLLHTWMPAFRRLVGEWTCKDANSMIVLIKSWSPVLPDWIINDIFNDYILPKLEQAIESWDLNPRRQDLDVWHQVMEWKHLLPPQSLVKLLVSHFFPKWLQVLGTWLNCDPNYDEVVEWYLGWKALLPQDIVQDPAIDEQLMRALVLMNRSLERIGCRVACVSPIVSATLDPPEPAVSQRLRELIEYRCAQLGILCIPLVNRFHDGKQIFRVGNALCHLDRRVIFVLESNVWTPVTIQQLFSSIAL